MVVKVLLVGAGKVIPITKYSKCMHVKELRQRIAERVEVQAERLRLFFGGKQLEDGYTVFDYNVNLDSTIHCLIRPNLQNNIETKNKERKEDTTRKVSCEDTKTKIDLIDLTNSSSDEEPRPGTSTMSNSRYERQEDDIVSGNTGNVMENLDSLQVGNIVEMIDDNEGAWFTVVIKDKYLNEVANDIVFTGEYKGCDNNNIKKVNFTEISTTKQNIRLPILQRVQLSDVKVGDIVKVIYNFDKTSKKGLWYDCRVKSVNLGYRRRLEGDIIYGRKKTVEENCIVTSLASIFRVSSSSGSSEPQVVECEYCLDRPTRRCTECSCHVCGGKNDPGKQVMCDECDYAYHIWCLTPKLDNVPDTEEWYCPECKNDENEIVKAGEKPVISKKKSKMMSYKHSPGENETKGKDWGQGMACASRTKECTIVPPNHFGPIPGVEVGSSWLFRMQVGEAGVHRPHVSGIHGRQEEGAYSIVLSGGYEDDKDDGESFMYTGSGGRDLSGNKRTSVQSSDQKLENLNLALARNCNAPVNKEVGAVAKDWRKGKPVRVVRNYKAAKHSKYAPKEGNRYDGIYKVVKYFPMKGKSGFRVWRYQLRRDDPVPAPWTKAGKERIESLGLQMQVPEGFQEKITQTKNKQTNSKNSAGGVKRSLKQTVLKELCEPTLSPSKKLKIRYEVENEIAKLIKKDLANEKLWKVCMDAAVHGKQHFLNEVQTAFKCICCHDLVSNPVTTSCKHNFCKACIDRAFAADVKTCPHCRYDLSSEKLRVNENLEKSLLSVFPGYSGGRLKA